MIRTFVFTATSKETVHHPTTRVKGRERLPSGDGGVRRFSSLPGWATPPFVIVLLLCVATPALGDDLIPWEESRVAPPDAAPSPEEEPIAVDEEVDTDEPGYEILDRRVVSEEIVQETVEPTRSGGLAPGTFGNAPIAWSNDRPSPGVRGAVGLPHMATARVGFPGSVRLGATGELFSAREFLVAGDRATRQAVTFAAAYTPLSWLETYGSASFVSASNTHGAPRLMQVQGDIALGAKTAWRLARGLSLGADVGLSLFPHIGATGVGAAGVSPMAVSTLDVRELAAEIPLLVHAEAGFVFDGTERLQGEFALTRIEEFALGVYHYDRFALALGLEMPLPFATPFAGWRMRAPLGEIMVPLVRDPDGTVRSLTYSELVSHVLTLGARITAVRDVTLLAAVDLGLSGAAVEGIPATMPWNVLLGVSYVFDPSGSGERETRVVERVVEVDRAVPPPPVAGRVTGLVKDAHTGEALDGAVVLVDAPDSHPVATTSDGSFLTHEIGPGDVTIAVAREGYRRVEKTTTVSAGEISSLELSLERAVEPARLTLSVASREPKEPVQARVQVQGPDRKELGTDDEGKLETSLTPGEYVLNISAEGFLTRQRNIEVDEAERMILDLELASEPEETLVTLGDGQLELSRQIHFQTGRSEILPDSYQILDQVIDLIARHDIERIRIEGHTDNQGGRALNMRLSNARAQAVRRYLLEQGIAEERIEAEGFGPDRPIAPNLTQRGRALNRRVEFHILGHKTDEEQE